MMGYTDRHYRHLLRLLSPHAVLYSEMITTGALLHGDPERFLEHEDDAPCAAQLGGSDPDELARCSRLVEAAGYQEVNLNVGCPSDRVQQGGIGACLMATPELVAQCYRAMQSQVGIPVTIKSRIGIDHRDDFGFFEAFVAALHDAGCRVFLIHARNAILQGLSPRENRALPPLRRHYVTRIKAMLPDSEFILNGGINSLDEALEHLLTCDGIMLGRAICNRPWLLAELEHHLFQTPLPSRLDILAQYRSYMARQMIRGADFRSMARHLSGLFSGLPGARYFRRSLSDAMNACRTDSANIEVAGIAALDKLVDDFLSRTTTQVRRAG